MKFKETKIGTIPNSWEVKPIKEITEIVTDYVANGNFASLAENVTYKDEEDVAVLIRLVDYNNDFQGKFVFIDEHAYEFLGKSKLYGDEIIISNVGANVGTVFRCPKLKYKMSLAPNSIMVKFKGNDDFYFHWLRGYNGQQMLKSIVTGSAQPKFNKTNFKEMLVPVPPIKEQNKIAAILNTIDEKISINKKINNNLEQQAQAIFKAWFVDFEPFGGELPNDWKHTKLGTSCNCVLGGTPSRNKIEYWNGTIPWINSGEVNKFRIIKPSETITNLGLEKSATKLLPTKTTVLAITGATLGQVSLLEIDACANQSVVGIIPNDNLPYEYIYPLIKQNIAELVSNQTGGAQQHINKQNVENLDIVIPPYTYLAKYQNTVCSIYEMIANNCFENERLSSLRDNLLPKLMSGELDVSNIDL